MTLKGQKKQLYSITYKNVKKIKLLLMVLYNVTLVAINKKKKFTKLTSKTLFK